MTYSLYWKKEDTHNCLYIYKKNTKKKNKQTNRASLVLHFLPHAKWVCYFSHFSACAKFNFSAIQFFVFFSLVSHRLRQQYKPLLKLTVLTTGAECPILCGSGGLKGKWLNACCPDDSCCSCRCCSCSRLYSSWALFNKDKHISNCLEIQ